MLILIVHYDVVHSAEGISFPRLSTECMNFIEEYAIKSEITYTMRVSSVGLSFAL